MAKEVLPSQDAILKITQVATTPEAARYFYNQFESLVNKARLQSEAGPLLNAVADNAEGVEAQSQTAFKPWLGDTRIATITVESNKFLNLQENLASSAAKEITAKTITFDFAVGGQSEFLRGCSSEKQPLDKKQESAMDTLFNAWLAKNGMLTLNGVIYEYNTDNQGQGIKPEMDSEGQPIKADPEKMKSLIASDEGNGFIKYLQEKKPDLELTAQAHRYTAPKAPVERAAPEVPSTGMDTGR